MIWAMPCHGLLYTRWWKRGRGRDVMNIHCSKDIRNKASRTFAPNKCTFIIQNVGSLEQEFNKVSFLSVCCFKGLLAQIFFADWPRILSQVFWQFQGKICFAQKTWVLVRPPPILRQNQKFWLKKVLTAPFESYSVCWQSFPWSRVWDMKSTSNNSDRSLSSAKCAEKKFELDSRYVWHLKLQHTPLVTSKTSPE